VPIDAAAECRGPIHALVAHVDAAGDEVVCSIWCSTSGSVWRVRVLLSLHALSRTIDSAPILRAAGERVQALQLSEGALVYALTAMNRLYDATGRLVASAVSLGVAFAQALLPAVGDAPVVCASGTYGGEVVGWCPAIDPYSTLVSCTSKVLWRIALHRPGCVVMCLSVIRVLRDDCVHYLISSGSDDRSTTLAHIRADGASVVWRESGSAFAKSRIRCVDSHLLSVPLEGQGTLCYVLQCVGGEDGTVQAFLVQVPFNEASGPCSSHSSPALLLWRASELYPAHGCSAIAVMPPSSRCNAADMMGRVLHGGFDGGVSVDEFPIQQHQIDGHAAANQLFSVPVAVTGKVRCLAASASHSDSIVVAMTEMHHIVVWCASFACGSLVAPLFPPVYSESRPAKPPCCAVVAKVRSNEVTVVAGYLDGAVWQHVVAMPHDGVLLSVASCRLHHLPTKIVHLIPVGRTLGTLTFDEQRVGFSDATSPGLWLASLAGGRNEQGGDTPTLRHIPGSFGAQCTSVAVSVALISDGVLLQVAVGASKKGGLCMTVCVGETITTVEQHIGGLVDCITIQWMSNCVQHRPRAHLTLVSGSGARRAWISLSEHNPPSFDVVWIDAVAPSAYPWHFSRALFASVDGSGQLLATHHGSTVKCAVRTASSDTSMGDASGVWRHGATWESVTTPRLIAADMSCDPCGTASALLCHSPDGEGVVVHMSILHARASMGAPSVHSVACRGASWVLQDALVDAPDMNCIATVVATSPYNAGVVWAVGGESTAVKVMTYNSGQRDKHDIIINQLCGGHISNVLGLAFLKLLSTDGAQRLVSVGSMATLCLWENDVTLPENDCWSLRARQCLDGAVSGSTAEAVPRYMCVTEGAEVVGHPSLTELFVGTSAGTLERFYVHTDQLPLLRRPDAHPTVVPCESAAPRSILCVAAAPPDWAPMRVLAGDTHGRLALVFQERDQPPLSVVCVTENAAVTAICPLPSTHRRRVACGLDSGVVWLAVIPSTAAAAVVFQSRVNAAATPIRSLLVSVERGCLMAVADGVMTSLTIAESAVVHVERSDYLPSVRAVAQAALDASGAVIAVGQGFCRMSLV
jgi:hypothetical protein